MHDIRFIRENPDAFDAGLARRGLSIDIAGLLEKDALRRSLITQTEETQARLKTLAGAIGRAMAEDDQDEAHRLKDEVSSVKQDNGSVSELSLKVETELRESLAVLPNIPAADVPDGIGEDDNVEVSRHGEPPVFAFEPREHDAIGPALGMDFDTGVAMAGARFTLLRGPVARLYRALGQFMLTTLARDHGYEQVVPPLLVRKEAMFGTGQLPKFADDLFQTTDDRWLIPTAEVSLTNIVREQILPEAELPLRFAALTPCFRSEAGAAGKDTRGFIRQHQFDKVEMVSIVTPETSEAEHERMTACAEDLLNKLGLPFRRMKLCAGDMGFTAARTYDLEVWLPGQKRYREISSCSTCTDFQARRMNARYRPEGEKGTRFVHTLNGSGLAVGRTLVAVMENYQQEDGSIAIPEVFQPYIHGLTKLEPKR